MAKRTEREELLSYCSDAHKDAYGTRPRDLYSDLSIEELRVVADELSSAVADAIEEQRLAQADAAVRYEATIREIIEAGAGDRETAIRWHKESFDDEYVFADEGYYEYSMGLEYGYFRNMAVAA